MRVFKSGTILGTLKFFDATKGFGFVETKEGDIFLHATRATGFVDKLISGAVVKLVYMTSQRGLEASSVISVSEPPFYDGEVKFYNTDKNFGFISCSELGDVFLSSSVALAAGVEPWAGLKVEFQCVPSRKGSMTATMIRPVAEVVPVSGVTETVAEDIPQPAEKKSAERKADKKKTSSRAAKLNGSAEHAASV